MANRKFSDLTALTAPAVGDLLPIVDISEAAAADKNKKITFGVFVASALSTAGIVVDASGNVNIDSNTFYVDAVNNRVGIGTTGPSSTLHVEGTSRFVASNSALFDGTTGTYSTWLYNGTAVGDIGTGNQVFSGGANTDFAITARSTTSLVFGTNSTEKARIDSSGRLLVGGSQDSGGALLQVFGDRIRVGTAKTPASASATGAAGEICWDANYIYVCTATNTWKRTAIATW